MPDEPLDVTPEDPSPSPDLGAPAPADRPVKNLQAEFSRKFSAIEKRLEDMRAADEQRTQAVLQYLATISQPASQPASPAPAGGDPLDDLWRRAQSGDRDAFVEHQRELARQEVRAAMQQQTVQSLVDRQLDAVLGRYPVLRDAAHPLTQHANAVYASLVQAGYAPGKAALLEAAKTAITDRPDLVQQLQPAPAARRAAAGAQSGASYRAAPAPDRDDAVRAATPTEQALAKRMGIDPEKIKGAKERFLKRRAEGRSSLGGVSAHLEGAEL